MVCVPIRYMPQLSKMQKKKPVTFVCSGLFFVLKWGLVGNWVSLSMKKKLIHINQDDFLKCDNNYCGFFLKKKDKSRTHESYINELCPKCSSNLLTKDDFIRHRKVLRYISFLNRWFGWLGTYPDDIRIKSILEVDCHKKITILKSQNNE